MLNSYLCYREMLWGNIRKKEVNTMDPDHILLVLKMGFYWEKLYNILSSHLNSCTTDAKPTPSNYHKAWMWRPAEWVPVVEMVDSVCHAKMMAAGCIPPFFHRTNSKIPESVHRNIFHSSAQWKCFTQSSWRTHRFPPYLCFDMNPFSLRWWRVLPLTSQGQACGWTCLEITHLPPGFWRIPSLFSL